MITISLCMIVKNEEDTIDACLASIKDCVDDIHIVDTGSTDRTKELVAKYTPYIYDFEWINEFAAARNFAFSKGTSEYLLWLDADDVLLPQDQEALKALKQTLDPAVDCVTFKYNYSQDEEGNPTLIFGRERLVKRDKGFQWVGFIHEYIGGDKENILDAEISVTHKRIHNQVDRNLNLYRQKLKEGASFNDRDTYYYGKELYRSEERR